jgi:hypothetical protein
MQITDILTELNIPFKQVGEHHHVTANFVGVNCPFCSSGENYKLGIPLTTRRVASCWSCGIHPLADVLVELSGRSWREIKELLGHVEETERIEKPKGRLVLPHGIQGLAKAHRRYLRNRGFNPTLVERLWKIRAISIAPQLSWRILIPIQANGQTVSWTTRSISDEAKRRYINASPEEEAIPIKSLLYGSDYIRHAAIVVEGPTDVWRIGPGSVATLGTKYTKAQVAKIAQIPVRAIVFDNEPVAQEQARKLCDELSCWPGKTLRIEIDSADPGSASRKEVARLRRILE